MSQKNGKRTLIDDIVDGARDLLESLDRLMNPGKRPQPVPIPVRSNPPRPEEDPRLRRR